MRNKRLSDQVLILQSIQCVREELAIAHANGEGDIVTTEIMGRLGSLYSCLNVDKIAEIIKQADVRSKHGQQ